MAKEKTQLELLEDKKAAREIYETKKSEMKIAKYNMEIAESKYNLARETKLKDENI